MLYVFSRAPLSKHNSNIVSARLVDTLNLVFANHTTYRLAVTNFGNYSAFVIMPWYVQVATVYVLEALMVVPGVFPYVCVTYSHPETYSV